MLLKLSGEALMGDRQYGIDPDVVRGIAAQMAEARRDGIELAVVVGGGNIFRGVAAAAGGHGPGHRPTTWACSPPS